MPMVIRQGASTTAVRCWARARHPADFWWQWRGGEIKMSDLLVSSRCRLTWISIGGGHKWLLYSASKWGSAVSCYWPAGCLHVLSDPVGDSSSTTNWAEAANRGCHLYWNPFLEVGLFQELEEPSGLGWFSKPRACWLKSEFCVTFCFLSVWLDLSIKHAEDCMMRYFVPSAHHRSVGWPGSPCIMYLWPPPMHHVSFYTVSCPLTTVYHLHPCSPQRKGGSANNMVAGYAKKEYLMVIF